MTVEVFTVGFGALEINAISGSFKNDDVYIQATPDPVTGDRFFEVLHRQVGTTSYTKLPILFGSTPVNVFTHDVTSLFVRLDTSPDQTDGGDDILNLTNIKPEFGFVLDTVVATPGADEPIQFEAYGGNDLVFGSAFADCIKAGEPNYTNNDNDIVYAGAGNDFIEGKAGSDELHGEIGDDIIFGFFDDPFGTTSNVQDGDDLIFGGPGEDHLYDNIGYDELNGGEGVDSFHLFADNELDKLIDEIIRDANGLGDFNGDGEIDRNWIDYPNDVGNVEVEFDHDYTAGNDAVLYTIDKTGDAAIPIGVVGNRGHARFLLVETIDAMFDALETYYNNGQYNGQYLAQWDFNNDSALKGL